VFSRLKLLTVHPFRTILFSVADLRCLSLIPDPNFFHHRFRIYSFPDPASKSISILTQFGFFIPGPDPDFLPILDTGFKKASVADPDPGLGAFLTPGSGIRDGRKSASGSGIRDEQPGSYFLELRNHFFAFLGLKYLVFDEDPGSHLTVSFSHGRAYVHKR
jgi:hypothetical protein